MSNGFRTVQMVLARNCECEEWFPFFYACLEEENGEYTHYMFDGMGYKMCIPLKGNEPLMFHNGPSLDQIDLPKKEKPKKDGGVKKKIHNVFSVIKKMLTDPEEEEEITDEN